jgi:hypothetical protein
VGGKQQTHDVQAWFCAQSREAIAAAGDKKRIGFGHISIIAEIQSQCNLFISETLHFSLTSNEMKPMAARETPCIWLLTALFLHGIL